MSETLLERLDKSALPSKDNNRVIAREFKGYLVYIGQNALSNERIISEHKHMECCWLHALGARGSHVILCHAGIQDTFTDEAIRFAGELALRFSRSKAKAVMYARLDSVRKPPGAGVGVFHPQKVVQLDL